MAQIGRREFIGLLGGAAAWPVAARGQQMAMPVIGFLRNASADSATHLVRAFRQGLAEAGFIEGQNFSIEYRWADGQNDLLPVLAADLIRGQAAAIVGNIESALAAKAATTTTPVVFVTGSDPIRTGLVASLNRPGGNVTGVVFTSNDLTAKRLGLLHELVPNSPSVAVLLNPQAPEFQRNAAEAEQAGGTIGKKVLIVKAANESDFVPAFATIVEAGAGALLIGGGAFFNSHRRQIITLAARHALPASYVNREYADAGGLMSYGASQPDAYRRAGNYVARILAGAKPGDLPVELASKFDMVINLASAKALGIEIPPMLLARADEVIE